ncbi:hypothetical protein IW262DRAFT_1300272 [Armillaria fumosa]|nr:hypothetical protein IW262DRAFT_1300272 [Armillaria fumosa]
MSTGNKKPSQDPTTFQWAPDNGTSSIPSLPVGPYTDAANGPDFATLFVATKFDAAPGDNANIASSIIKSKQEGDDASGHAFNFGNVSSGDVFEVKYKDPVHMETVSDMTKSVGNSAKASYRSVNFILNSRYAHGLIGMFEKQADGVPSASDAVTRGPMELQNSDLETDNDTSSVNSRLLRRSKFLNLTNPTGIVRSFQLSLSQGDDSDILLRVRSDYIIIVCNVGY